MARGKHAATLFEVFQKGKRADGPTSWSIPKWFNWSTVKPASAPVRPMMKMTAPVKRAAAPLPKPPPPVTARSQALAGPTWIDYLRDWLEENKRTALPSLIGAAAAIVLIALVLLFRHSAGASGVPGMPGLKSTAELRRGPAHPEVLDVTGATRAHGRKTHARRWITRFLPFRR